MISEEEINKLFDKYNLEISNNDSELNILHKKLLGNSINDQEISKVAEFWLDNIILMNKALLLNQVLGRSGSKTEEELKLILETQSKKIKDMLMGAIKNDPVLKK